MVCCVVDVWLMCVVVVCGCCVLVVVCWLLCWLLCVVCRVLCVVCGVWCVVCCGRGWLGLAWQIENRAVGQPALK